MFKVAIRSHAFYVAFSTVNNIYIFIVLTTVKTVPPPGELDET